MHDKPPRFSTLHLLVELGLALIASAMLGLMILQSSYSRILSIQ